MNLIWTWFDGKKRVIALIYWTILPLVPVIYPDGIPKELNNWLTAIGLLLSTLGLGHAAIKSYNNGKVVLVEETPVVTETVNSGEVIDLIKDDKVGIGTTTI